MAYTDTAKVRLLSNLTTDDVSDDDVSDIITESTKSVNKDINVLVPREKVGYINESRQNNINGSNTVFYVRNFEGRYISDTNDDGSVNKSDVIVYLVASDGTESLATVTSVDSANGSITLSSAPSSEYRMYITYSWAYANPQTPDAKINLATTCLSIAYCYAKVNWGRAPRQEYRNVKLYRHMQSFDLWEKRYKDIIDGINSRQSDIKVIAELDPAYYGQS